METRANYVVIGAFTMAAVVAAFLFVMWIAGYTTPGGHRTFQVVFNGSVSGLSNGANVLLQRHQGRRGHASHVLQERSPPGRSRHRRQRRRPDRPEHQGAARDCGNHWRRRGRAAWRVNAWGAPGWRERPGGDHLRRAVDAAAGDSRQCRRPLDQGDRGSGRRRESHHRQFRADPFGDRECRCVLQGAG